MASVVYAQNNTPNPSTTSVDGTAPTTETGITEIIPATEDDYIITALEFMESVSARYGEMNDFQSLLVITRNGVREYSELYVKPPTKFRIVFQKPEGQVISSDGEDFYVFLPEENVVLHQKRSQTSGSAGTFVTRTGLDLLLKNYTVSYVDNADFTRIEDEERPTNGRFTQASTKLVQIRLRRKSSTQSFQEIILSIGEDKLIQIVEANTYNNEKLRFDFIKIFINEGIPDSKFDFEVPATAPVIDDLFFKETKETEGVTTE